ncbi:hypothetical protein JTE90_011295 [Oedothorax gibbosus]|uniref:Uncharacterized protein n=1 Tax=Oedothorax gibbosus TaxID=931172 RepID=A0AAV6VMU1_9ARAC|nr:hypothetical protein JTE90_011295 [Oedothorax gibbosus]
MLTHFATPSLASNFASSRNSLKWGVSGQRVFSLLPSWETSAYLESSRLVGWKVDKGHNKKRYSSSMVKECNCRGVRQPPPYQSVTVLRHCNHKIDAVLCDHVRPPNTHNGVPIERGNSGHKGLEANLKGHDYGLFIAALNSPLHGVSIVEHAVDLTRERLLHKHFGVANCRRQINLWSRSHKFYIRNMKYARSLPVLDGFFD